MAFFDERISPYRALVGILFSALIVGGLSILGWLYYLHVKEQRIHDSQYHVVAIVQASKDKELLQTRYLAELLGLSVDRPTNLFQLDREAAEKMLLSSPLIKQASIKKILPGTLYIDYRIRMPVVYLGDYTNTALDSGGVLMPFVPFFTPKRLPVVYIGLEEGEKTWGQSLDDERAKLAFDLLREVQPCCLRNGMQLKQVDVSKAFADSYGQRQIVVVVEESDEEEKHPVMIARLNPSHWRQNIDQLIILRDHLSSSWQGSTVTIDLRLPHLAFIKNE